MNLSLKDLPAQLGELLGKTRRYAVILFLLLVAAVYGFMVVRISAMQNAQPTNAADSQQVTTVVTPRIDPGLIKQLKQLQDNSVSVKSLFDQARSNPFQE